MGESKLKRYEAERCLQLTEKSQILVITRSRVKIMEISCWVKTKTKIFGIEKFKELSTQVY